MQNAGSRGVAAVALDDDLIAIRYIADACASNIGDLKVASERLGAASATEHEEHDERQNDGRGDTACDPLITANSRPFRHTRGLRRRGARRPYWRRPNVRPGMSMDAPHSAQKCAPFGTSWPFGQRMWGLLPSKSGRSFYSYQRWVKERQRARTTTGGLLPHTPRRSSCVEPSAPLTWPKRQPT